MNFYTKKIISPGKCFVFPGMVLICILLAFAGCNKEDTPGSEMQDFSHIKPKATAKGEIAGALVTRLIGSGGGEVLSADGRMKLVIPAGALDANTNIGIQPITNMAPLGLGNNYRLTPEGINFSKPVTLVFNYNEVALTTSIPEFLWVVTQNADGTWAGGRKSVVNKTGKTVSVTTTHFSDWGIGRFMDIALTPSEASVKKGENVSLSIAGFKYDPDEDDDYPPLGYIDNDLVGLTESQHLLLTTEHFVTFRVKYWALNESKAPVNSDKGKLEVSGKKATYTAPDKAPDPSTVTVSVNLEAKDNTGLWHAYSLLSNITIIGDYYLKLTADGKESVYIERSNGSTGEKVMDPVTLVAGQLIFSGAKKNASDSKGQLTITVKAAGVGSFPLENSDMFLLQTDSYVASTHEGKYVNFYPILEWGNNTCLQKDLIAADMKLTITAINQDEIEGHFSGKLYDSSLKVAEQCMNPVSSINVSVEFKMKLLRL